MPIDPPAFWVTAAAAVAANLISTGFSLAAIVGGGGALALYAGARSLGLLAASAAATGLRSKTIVVTLALASALVQGLDAVIGLTPGDLGRTLGPLVLAVGLGVSGLVLARR